jgi:hypothetical protein
MFELLSRKVLIHAGKDPVSEEQSDPNNATGSNHFTLTLRCFSKHAIILQ